MPRRPDTFPGNCNELSQIQMSSLRDFFYWIITQIFDKNRFWRNESIQQHDY